MPARTYDTPDLVFGTGMKFLGWLVGIVALVGVLSFGFQSVQSNKDEAEIRSKIALLKAHGWPTCGDDMPKGPAEAENAYLDIAPHIVKNRETVTPKEPILKGFDTEALMEPGDEAYLRQALAMDREVLDIAATAFRSKKAFYVSRKWDQGFMMLLPDLAAFKTMARALMGEVVLAVRAGDMHAARERLDWVHRMERSMCEEPIVISLLVSRSVMIIEQKMLLRLYEQGRPVLPLMQEAKAAWAACKPDVRAMIGAEQMTGLTTARYLDDNRFWREQSFPWNLRKTNFDEKSYSFKFPKGDSIPASGGARRKLLEALNSYLAIDALVANKLTSAHVTQSVHAAETLWANVNMFSAMVGSAAGSEPTIGAQVEMIKMQPAIMDFAIRVLEFRSSQGRLPRSSKELGIGELSKADGLVFDWELDGKSVVLKGIEGANEVSRMTVPVVLDEKGSTFATRRDREIKRLADLANPKSKTRLGFPPPGTLPAGVPPPASVPSATAPAAP